MRLDLCYESRLVFLKCKKGGRAATLPLFSVWAELVSQIMHYEKWFGPDADEELIYGRPWVINAIYITWPEIVQHFLADNLVVLDATVSFLVKRCDLGENTSSSPDNFAVYLTKIKYFSMWKILLPLGLFSVFILCWPCISSKLAVLV